MRRQVTIALQMCFPISRYRCYDRVTFHSHFHVVPCVVHSSETPSTRTNADTHTLYQCEAEGFRRITPMMDRPDAMALYKVRLEADKSSCPVLLSNGNLVNKGDLPNGRHFTEWVDPFKKPSYLFAVVAGEDDDACFMLGRCWYLVCRYN